MNTTRPSSSVPSSMRMRIAILGGGGLAYLLAQQITQGINPVLILSRSAHAEFEEDFACQVAVVDFNDVEELHYTLQGVDVVISTISGSEQLNVIDAAVRAKVGIFVPAEFEGELRHRDDNDPLDRGSRSALGYLEHYASRNRIRYTVFSCGVFMESFAPGGLQRYKIGAGYGVQSPDDYLVNVESAVAEMIEANDQGEQARVSLTSVRDVARLVTAAIESGTDHWPREIRMAGDQMQVQEIVETCEAVRRVPFTLSTLGYDDAVRQAEYCRHMGYSTRGSYLQRLLETANGRFEVRETNIDDFVIPQPGQPEIRPVAFRDWLQREWGPAA